MEEIKVVPVDPIHKDSRGWINTILILAGGVATAAQLPQLQSVVALPQVKSFLVLHPALVAGTLGLSGLANLILTIKSKWKVVSKNVKEVK